MAKVGNYHAATATVSVDVDTAHLVRVLELVGKHATACAKELRELAAANPVAAGQDRSEDDDE